MTAIERTAYPRAGRRPDRAELRAHYDLAEAEHAFLRRHARGGAGRPLLALVLKTRAHLGHFPAPSEVTRAVVDHLAAQLDASAVANSIATAGRTKSFYRYQDTVRARLGAKAYGAAGRALVTDTVRAAAATMSDPADLINRAIEALGATGIDLPAFSALDRLVGHLRAEVHEALYRGVATRLDTSDRAVLDALLVRPDGAATTPFNRLKQTPGPPTPKTLRLWIDRLDWLDALPDDEGPLDGIAHDPSCASSRPRPLPWRLTAFSTSFAQPSATPCCSRSCARRACAPATSSSRWSCAGSGARRRPRARRSRRCAPSTAVSRRPSSTCSARWSSAPRHRSTTPRSARACGRSSPRRAVRRPSPSACGRSRPGIRTTTCRCSGQSMRATARCCSASSTRSRSARRRKTRACSPPGARWAYAGTHGARHGARTCRSRSISASPRSAGAPSSRP